MLSKKSIRANKSVFINRFVSSLTLLVFTFIQSISFRNALIAAEILSEKRGAVWGFFLTIEGMGMIVGPVVSGKLWDLIGPQAPFITSGAVLMVLFVLHFVISLDKKVVVR